MLGEIEAGRVLELTESAVEGRAAEDMIGTETADLVLEAFEIVTLLSVQTEPGAFQADVQSVCERLVACISNDDGSEEALESSSPSEPSNRPGGAEPTAAPHAGSVVALPQNSLDARTLQPLVTDLYRLQAERAGLPNELRELERMLSAYVAELDINLSPEKLKERLIKTIGYGPEIRRRLASLRRRWGANEFVSRQTIEQVDTLTKRAALVSIGEMRESVERIARTTARKLGKSVRVQFSGDAYIDASVEARLRPACVHLIRNAVDHGIEAPEERYRKEKDRIGTITFQVRQNESDVHVRISDDGAGIDFDRLRERLGGRGAGLSETELIQALFEHGFSTRERVTEISGRGVGLDVVHDAIVSVGGQVAVQSAVGAGTTFEITVPALLRADLIVGVIVVGAKFAIPARAIVGTQRVADLIDLPGGVRIKYERDGHEELIPLLSLASVLDLPGQVSKGDTALILRSNQGLCAFAIECFESPRTLPFHPVSELAFSSTLIRGVACAEEGDVYLLLDPATTMELALREGRGSLVDGHHRRARVLVAEDAPVARELLCGILRSFGLSVIDKPDGKSAWEYAQDEAPDLVITDLEMPGMDGFELIRRLKAHEATEQVPIVMLTTKSDERTRQLAASLGVRALLSKQRFVEEELRMVVEQCLEA